MKSMNLEKLKFYPKKTVEKLASFHLVEFKDRVFEQGKDKDGARFRPYSLKYRDLKARGFTKLNGERYAFLKGQPASTQTSPPDFTLTGKTNKATHIEGVTTDSYKINWRGEPALIVQGNAERGRDIRGIPDGEIKKVINQLGDLTDKQMKRIIKNVNIKLQ